MSTKDVWSSILGLVGLSCRRSESFLVSCVLKLLRRMDGCHDGGVSENIIVSLIAIQCEIQLTKKKSKSSLPSHAGIDH